MPTGLEALPPATPEGVPLVPSASVRKELEDLLRAEDSVLGEVWTAFETGLDAADIPTDRGTKNPNFVWIYNRKIKALLQGDLPTARTVAQRTASTFRSFLNKGPLSADAKETLQYNLQILEIRSAKPKAGTKAAKPGAAEVVTTGDILIAIQKLRLSPQGGGFAAHKPLILLWALARLSADPEASRLFSFAAARKPVQSLLGAVTGAPSARIEDPF